jgi:hypothetical protein
MHAMPSMFRQVCILLCCDLLLLTRDHPGPAYLRMLIIAYLCKTLILFAFPVSYVYGLLMWAAGGALIYRALALYFDVSNERWHIGTPERKEMNEPMSAFMLALLIWFTPWIVAHYDVGILGWAGLTAPTFMAEAVAEWQQVIDRLELDPQGVVTIQAALIPISYTLNIIAEGREQYEVQPEMPKRAEMSFPDAS